MPLRSDHPRVLAGAHDVGDEDLSLRQAGADGVVDDGADRQRFRWQIVAAVVVTGGNVSSDEWSRLAAAMS